MSKKLLIIFTALIIILEISMHYYFNMADIVKPPSSTWSKEVLIDTANIENTPKIIRYKDTEIIAFNNGQAVKVISTDKYGTKLYENTFSLENQVPYNITLLTDDSKIYLSYTNITNTKNIETLRLDEKLNLEDKTEIKDVTDLIQIDKNVMIISYKDKIEVRNIKTNTTAVINVLDTKYLMGTKYKDNYIVGFNKEFSKFYYSYIRDGIADEPKYAGTIDQTSRTSFSNSAMVFDDKMGYILSEFRTKGEFGGAIELKFSLENETFETGPFKMNGNREFISNITPYTENNSSKFLVSTNISRGKKKEFLNVAELNMNGNRSFIPVSRINGSAINIAVSEDKVIFCKPIETGKVELYMASNSESFIQKHNNLRNYEVSEGVWETLENVINSLVYIFIYGVLWIIPAVVFNIISFLFEYKPSNKLKRIWYILSYAVALLMKIYFINKISYGKYKYFMPDILSFSVSMTLISVFSLLYCIYGYKKYVKDVENNIMIVHFFIPLLIDTIVTLILFVPFVV